MDIAKLVAFNGHGLPMEVLSREIPVLKAGEILIKNLYTTICGSDLHTFCGFRQEKVPTVLGHEIVGEIVEFHPNHNKRDYSGNVLEIGDRVTWSIFSSNPNSALAIAGMPQKGDDLFKYGHAQITDHDALHGGLSTHCIIRPGTTVLKLSLEIPLSVAATINCAIATVAGAIRLAGEVSNKKVFISGSGLLGIVCSAMCKTLGASMICMADINAERLTLSREFGVDRVFLSSETNQLPTDIDLVFDMSGSPDAMETGLETLTLGGIAIWIGAVFKARPVQINAEKMVRNLNVIKGLHNYNYDDFAAAVKFITAYYTEFPFEKIVSDEFSLDDSEKAFQYAVAKKPIRVGINMLKNADNEN
ncbi:zinc-binding dehydrogenase [Pedobacter metabolipauper]|uniref:alcohol dehydrogenase n=1 Tax=Pedobacter metabolipauper TaxID=425513 RepID=A0A4R6SV40_9SPHI|nr:alcohol dehydrogenase catalytic domain-containing protein [Pedobacter metabolipauper]TDQ08309.1 2-desacetyl-2-hydroxyethyl bacteriochlorophyllide A dehydrogenase [Pedobacter metabolipauper]